MTHNLSIFIYIIYFLNQSFTCCSNNKCRVQLTFHYRNISIYMIFYGKTGTISIKTKDFTPQDISAWSGVQINIISLNIHPLVAYPKERTHWCEIP